MSRPTETAEWHFQNARITLGRLHLKSDPDGEIGPLAASLLNVTNGLIQLSIGLRATYIELEEVKRMLQKQQKR